jgi:hypothetical protein
MMKFFLQIGNHMSENKTTPKRVPNIPVIKAIQNKPPVKNKGPVAAIKSAPMRKSGRGR